MPRIRTLGANGDGAFKADTGAGWWILDGLEITDNAGHNLVHTLVDFGLSASGVHDMTVQRCYFHQKEIGTNYNRSVMRAVWFDGATSSGLIEKWNYIYLIGYHYPENAGGVSFYQMDTTSLLSVGASGNILLEDNYISVWWNGLFLGGGDTAPTQTATLSNASTRSATFSSATGLIAGKVVRFGLEGTGTARNSGITFTRASGATLTSADVGRNILIRSTVDGSRGLVKLSSVSGDTYTVAAATSGIVSDGACTWVAYETAMVRSVSGTTVNYTPYGHDSLQHAPQSAAWCSGDEGRINDVTVRKNTFYIDPVFAQDVYTHKGYSPKGAFEIKNSNRMTVEGNRFLGYPGVMAWTTANQNGTAPWITNSHITIRNNWFAPDRYAKSTRSMITISDDGYLQTITPTTDVEIYNNLAKNVSSLLQLNGGDNWSIRHNTILNDAPSDTSYHATVSLDGAPATNWSFRDNIVSHSSYGMSCAISPNTLETCWPSGVFTKNVVVDTAGAGFGTNVWGAGGVLGSTKTAFSQVGFTDPVNDNYRLATSSPYRGKGSDGKDPGVNMDDLLSALAGGNSSPNKSK